MVNQSPPSKPVRLTALICLAWALGACVADTAAPPSAAAAVPPGNPLLEPVQTQDYIPGSGTTTRRGASTQNPATAQTTPAPSQRRGSGTSPDLLAPPAVPAGPTTIKPKDSTTDTARFKRDLLQPGVNDLQQRDNLHRLDPIQQRDLFNRQNELHRLETDPLRR